MTREKELKRTEKVSRHDLGREEFLRRVWAWKEKYGSRIGEQHKALGASLDWERERFTMDEGLSRAVREVFVSLYEKGLVYRGNYIINWCPRCLTTISDLENVHRDETGTIWTIRYHLEREDGTPDPDRTGEPVAVVAVDRLAQLEHDVVGDVDGERDRGP